MSQLVNRFFFKLYRLTLGPLLHTAFGAHAGCRFEPSCSHYAEVSVKRFGIFRGGWKALARILSCHPFSSRGGKTGFDPVPHAIQPSSHRRKL